MPFVHQLAPIVKSTEQQNKAIKAANRLDCWLKNTFIASVIFFKSL
jgi:hypothetical protein